MRRNRMPPDQKSRIALIAATPTDGPFAKCVIPGCGLPTRRAAGQGLSYHLCRTHDLRQSRAGCPTKGTYSRADLAPYRKAASKFLRSHRDDEWVSESLRRIEAAMWGSGPNHRVVDTLIMPPRDKARAALARLRAKETPPERILEIALAVSAAVAQDPIRPILQRVPHEYRLCQIAKACLRIAGGYTAHYGPGSVYRRYPRSTGKLLRYLGAEIDQLCEATLSRHLGAVLALVPKPDAQASLGAAG